MRLSRYTIFIEDFPGAKQCLVFNTRTQAQVVVDETLRDALDRLPERGTDAPMAETFARLEKMGMLVEDGVDENRVIEQWFRRIKTGTKTLHATILSTYDCNFACTYCVEEGVKSAFYMDEGTALRTVGYIKAKAIECSPESLSARFYGGEPLLNMKALRIVAKGLEQFSRQSGIPFTLGMTTNGALLTPRVVDELKGYGLKRVKITLDGTRELHNRKRPFKNGKGSFDVIIRHILSAVDKIDVDVGGNFDDENRDSFPGLLDYLKDLGLASRLHRVNFKPVSATMHEREAASSPADMGCVYFEPGVRDSLISLRRAVMESGFRAGPGIGVNLCSMAMNTATFIIDPEGRIFRCPAFVGRHRFAAGDIYHEGQEDFSTSDLWRRCIECAYVPLCGDGCLYAAYTRFGDLTRLNCRKDFMEFMVRENLKLNYTMSHRKRTP